MKERHRSWIAALRSKLPHAPDALRTRYGGHICHSGQLLSLPDAGTLLSPTYSSSTSCPHSPRTTLNCRAYSSSACSGTCVARALHPRPQWDPKARRSTLGREGIWLGRCRHHRREVPAEVRTPPRRGRYGRRVHVGSLNARCLPTPYSQARGICLDPH